MNPILRNVLAAIAGFVVGSVVNMGLILLGIKMVPLPEGVDLTNLGENVHLFELKHFIFPFFAHAIGTLVGAFVAAKIAATHKMKFAIGIGVFFLIGGVVNVMTMVGSPMWFNVLDIVCAYIPMGWLGGKLAGADKNELS